MGDMNAIRKLGYPSRLAPAFGAEDEGTWKNGGSRIVAHYPILQPPESLIEEAIDSRCRHDALPAQR